MKIFYYGAHLFLLGVAALFGMMVALTHYPWLVGSMRTTLTVTMPSIVVDDAGREIMRFQRHMHAPVPLREIPPIVRAAFLATEDRHFYQHAGISYMGILRSLFHNMYHHRFAQGASTITQQLVRLLFFDTRKTLWRKIKEQMLALVIERQATKDQILEAYLNHVYLGCGMYGIAAAAEQLWGKRVDELGPCEAAILAGIVQSPRKYCPLLNPHYALKRRNVVLSCMERAGYISQKERDRYSAIPLTLHREELMHEAGYVREMLIRELEPLVGRQRLYDGGLVIATTLRADMQAAAEKSFEQQIKQLRGSKYPTVDGALVTLEAETGAIKALVGGYSFSLSQFNRATHAIRQIGSSIKPLLYAIALEHGCQMSDIVVDEPISIMCNGKLWEPRNVTRLFEGPITRARGLMISSNVVAVKTLQELGPEVLSHRLSCIPGIAVPPLLSVALGCVEMSPLSLTALFNTIANNGVWCKPHMISAVRDASGALVWVHQNERIRLMNTMTAHTIAHLLEQTFQHWLSRQKGAYQSGHHACLGKTGTTNDWRNCWYVGATPSYTTVVYLGSDDHRPLPHMYTSRTAQPLWYEYTQTYTDPRAHFIYHPLLEERHIHAITGAEVLFDDPHRISVLFPAL